MLWSVVAPHVVRKAACWYSRVLRGGHTEEMTQDVAERLSRLAFAGRLPEDDAHRVRYAVSVTETVARSASRRVKREGFTVDLAALDAHPGNDNAFASPAARAAAKHELRRVAVAMNALAPSDRHVIMLAVEVETEGLPRREAAETLGINGVAFGQRLLRARARLRAALGDTTHPPTRPRRRGKRAA